MADALTSRAAATSAPDRIDADLAALWRQVDRDGAVSRAVMSNLVVFCDCPTAHEVDLAEAPIDVAPIVARHPSRVILLHHDSAAAHEQGPLAARVEVRTFGPPSARYGVEQITVRSACGEASLPSIIRRLIAGDLPTVVWWTEDFGERPPLPALVGMGRQLLYDSRTWVDVRKSVLALQPLLDDNRAPDIADVNWRRLAPIQQAIRHASFSGGANGTAGPHMQVSHRSAEAALAWLLAGWLSPLGPVTVSEADDLDVPLRLTCANGTGPRIDVDQSVVRVTDRTGTTFTVGARETWTDGCVAELQSLGTHSSLVGAIGRLARRFSTP